MTITTKQQTCKKVMVKYKFLLIFMATLCTNALFAADDETPPPVFLDVTHQRISDKIINLSNKIDSFFGDERIDDEANTTRIRLFSVTTFKEAQKASTEANFRIQLRLPRTEKRLQLVIEREQDAKGDDATTPSTATGESSESNLTDKTTAGLRYLLDVADISFSSELGVRINWPPQIFFKMRFRKNINFGEWIFRPVEEILWVDREGWFSDLDLNFDRRLDSSWLFRFVNNVRWDNQDYKLRFQHGPSLFHKINDQIGMSYNMRATLAEEPNLSSQNYQLGIGYRQLLYDKWFFWEVSPALNFPREENFRRTPVGTIKFEAIFGRI
ncbi:MAG: hypothetical protein KC478_02595 [Bacteriovoracaceae bacterium]|nr:hypothetical protein [Bacteriovoracaceae bacterium]